eukprot:m.352316 g.352316  ORF g.352316 m.352316 type:complete len:54 (-) comp16487_c0_seq1:337-498(-)
MLFLHVNGSFFCPFFLLCLALISATSLNCGDGLAPSAIYTSKPHTYAHSSSLN